MKFYLFEVRDCDGNDVTAYDAIVPGASKAEASEKLWAYLEELYPDDEHDGGFGTYHACDCEPPPCEHEDAESYEGPCDCADEWRQTWECSHGGLLTDEDSDPGPQVFSSYEDAKASRATYHCLIDLTDRDGYCMHITGAVRH